MKKIKILTFLVLFLFSCSPVKKLERLHKRHPEVFEKVTDTLIFTDTIFDTLPGSSHDTSFHRSFLYDTVIIQNGISKTTIYQIYDTIYVDSETDTVFVEKEIEKKIPYPVYKVPEKSNDRGFLFWILLTFIGMLVIIVLILAVKKPP